MQPWQSGRTQMIERLGVAEEKGFVGGQGLDHLVLQRPVVAEQRHQGCIVAQTQASGHGGEPGVEQIHLVRPEGETGAALDQCCYFVKGAHGSRFVICITLAGSSSIGSTA